MADQDQYRLTDGVSAGAIRAFLDDLKREFPDSFAGMTTRDACKQLVMPRTKAIDCAYVDLLRRSSPQSVGKATVFVSHAWQYKVTDLLDMLLKFAKEKEEKQKGNRVFFWFDIFTINQNASVTANLPQEWWSMALKESIESIGCVLLVLMPWHDPTPLTRVWCVWELFCGISNERTEVNFWLPKIEEQALEEAIIDDADGAVKSMLVRVDAQRAEAHSRRDKAMIFHAIETSAGGFDAVNEAIKDQLRSWCLRKAMAAVEAMQQRGEGTTPKFAALCNHVGMVLRGFGKTDKAIEYYDQALRIRLETEGELAPNVAVLYNNLGNAHHSKAEYSKMIQCFEKALEIHELTLGNKHPQTAETCLNLGSAYCSKGLHDRAIEKYKAAIKVFELTLGKKHPKTAEAYSNLGSAYDGKRNYDEAIKYHKKAEEIQVETLDKKCLSIAHTYSNLGTAYDNTGNKGEAIKYYAKALRIIGETLGENHASTAMLLENIGLLHKDRGDRKKACEYIQRAVNAFMATLGPDHPNTVKAKENLQRLCVA